MTDQRDTEARRRWLELQEQEEREATRQWLEREIAADVAAFDRCVSEDEHG